MQSRRTIPAATQGSVLVGGGTRAAVVLVQSRDKKGQKWKQREGERPAFVAVASVADTARYTALCTSASLVLLCSNDRSSTRKRF